MKKREITFISCIFSAVILLVITLLFIAIAK
jgi:hypothetical protein